MPLLGESDPPEGLGVEAGVVRQHGVEGVLQHEQTTVGLLLHGQQEADPSVKSCCKNHVVEINSS